MNKLVLNTLAIALVVGLAGSASAGTVAAPGIPGCSVWVPDGYQTDSTTDGSNSLLMALDPKGKAGFLYAAVDAKDFDAAMAVLDGIVGKLVTDVQVTKGGAIKVNKIPGIGLKGTGKGADDGSAVTLGAVLLQPTEGKVLIVIGMVDTASKAAYAKVSKKVLAGIKMKK